MKNETNIGIILNYILIAVTNASSLIITPVLIGGIGATLYGIYFLVFSIMTFLIMIDFGIGTAVIRNIVKFVSKKDDEGLENYIFWTLIIYAGFAAAAFLFCMLVYSASPVIFQKYTPSELALFKRMFLVMSANCVFMFLQNFLFAVITGFEKIIFTRVCNIIRFSLRIALFFFVITKGFDPVALFVIDLGLSIIVSAVFWLYMKKLGVKIKRRYFDKAEVKENIRSMAYLYIMPLSENSFWTICNVIITATVGPESVAVFGIAATFCQIFMQLAATLSYFKMPKISELWFTKGDGPEYKNYVSESGRTQSVFLGTILLCFIIFGKPFLNLWVGDAFTVSYYLGLFMMIPLFLPLCQSMLEVASYARNKYLGRALILLCSTVFNSGLLWVGIRMFGLMGAAYAVAITTVIFRMAAMDVYFYKIGIAVKDFIKDINIKILPAIIVPGAAAAVILIFAPNSLLLQIAGGIAALAVYMILIYATYLTSEQKQAVKSQLNRFSFKR